MNRTDMLAAMHDRSISWDVIIIGGGATGLGAALESATRGHRTVLVEAHDFSGGTSSRSTKLIHGGVRYLRQGQIGMVRQSLRERERLLRNAPHIVHELNFVLPTFRPWMKTFYFLGLRLYDLLGGRILTGGSRRLSREETLGRLPGLQDTGLCGGVLYSDGQFDDARLAVTLARTAADNGTVLANGLCVTRLLRKGQRVTGLVARDRESDVEIQLEGRVVLNATGVFAEEILQMDTVSDDPATAGRAPTAGSTRNDPAERGPRVIPSQGSHLVLDSHFLPGRTAMMIPETDDGRVLFLIPWHGKLLLGTTDLAVDCVVRNPVPLESEIDYLLDHAGRYLTRRPTRSDVRSQFSGLRPLVSESGKRDSTSAISREHWIRTSDSGLITVIGGKWTTYRQMGEDLINEAERCGGLPCRRSRTANLPLHGHPENHSLRRDRKLMQTDRSGQQTPESGRTVSSTQVMTDERQHSGSSMDDWLKIYGSDADAIRALGQQDPELSERLHPELPYIGAEVVWAARHEMARTVEDVLARRTRALFLDAAAAESAAPRVARLLAGELQKSVAWQEDQVTEFSRVVSGWRPKT